MANHRVNLIIENGIRKKYCTFCKVLKPCTDFNFRKDRHQGRVSRCKTCLCEQSKNRVISYSQRKTWYLNAIAKNPNYARQKSLKRFYGITIDDYEKILESQNGVCGICLGPPMGMGHYHVDHDHKNKKIRGLLCHKCNVALGMVQDRIDLLHRFIAYLVKNST